MKGKKYLIKSQKQKQYRNTISIERKSKRGWKQWCNYTSATHLIHSNKESESNRIENAFVCEKWRLSFVYLRVSSFLTHIRFILNRFNPEIHKHMKIIKSVDIEGKHALSGRSRRRHSTHKHTKYKCTRTRKRNRLLWLCEIVDQRAHSSH